MIVILHIVYNRQVSLAEFISGEEVFIYNEIEIDEALKRKDILYADVRSPKEYNREKIPGAVNLPLFNDEEHRELGIIFRELGSAAARKKGIEFAGPKLSDMLDELLEIAGDRTPLIYCWRGGLRSLSFYQILYLAGIPALRLKGGYKAYRRYVYHSLKDYRFTAQPIILHGLTGTGKTIIIEELLRLGYPAINLENLAQHRGSAFGKIGYMENRSQKDFESLLWSELMKFDKTPFIVLEKEGKKIGPALMPPFIVEAMEEGIHLLLEAPLPVRAQRIIDEYMKNGISAAEKEPFIAAINAIKPYLEKETLKKIFDLFNDENYYEVVLILCRDYYDKYYRDARRDRYRYAEIIDTASLEEATAKIISFTEKFLKKRRFCNESP